MDHREAVSYLNSLHSRGIHPGTDTVAKLCAALGKPQNAYGTVHIAGTNGKGSTAAYTAAILSAAGHKAGCFTSPYIRSVRESICVSGEPVSEKIFAAAIGRVKNAADKSGLEPTEFELLTAAAFLCFAEEGCDTAVIECGLGGRDDATNIIDAPKVAVLTEIDIDHAAFLGDTVEEISKNKCGIIKSGCTVVSLPNGVVSDVAAKLGCRCIICAPENISVDKISLDGTCFTYRGEKFCCRMAGRHQAQNAALAIEAARAFDKNIDNGHISKGLAIQLPARFQILDRSLPVILDGAHNPNGASAVADTLSALGITNVTAVIGMMRDKDHNGFLSRVTPICSCIVTVAVRNNPRSMSAGEMADEARRFCADVSEAQNSREALEKAKSAGRPVLIIGSLYLAADILAETEK